ncbi:AmmeMemoRadiSam system protein B [Desulfobacter latus]|uniref:AmmeMemoRadiSam system protein B n=1 Tax=Desulfobacter latus TaxID=2292 RepID=A0A850SVD9_9BACT|nr:AmmeMemoRadiSam system protein B [Desulfobacter latus]NWH05119.1 AmmeMemoRadiSam system protein B [Desulfobacter latus]
MAVKKIAFAGSWYPGSADQCRSAIKQFTDDFRTEDDTKIPDNPVAGIVPHAGWIYSGKLACRVFAALTHGNRLVDTIVLFGVHMHADSPAFVLDGTAVETPLGSIEIDRALTDALVQQGTGAGVDIKQLTPRRFPEENTLELQYPFIKYFFPKARIVVCAVPPSDAAQALGVAAVVAAEELNRSLAVVGSTDMTHYGPRFGFEPAGSGRAAFDWVAKENDAAAINALTAMDEKQIIHQGLSRHNMCCSGAACAAVAAAKKMGAVKGVCLDYASSFDPLDPNADFVGYCGMIFGT